MKHDKTEFLQLTEHDIALLCLWFQRPYEANKAGDGWWEDAAEGTYGIDQFIGEPDFLGKGLGTEIIKRFCDLLFKQYGAIEIIADPKPGNLRAVRAYEKAGFCSVGIQQTPDGQALIMTLKR